MDVDGGLHGTVFVSQTVAEGGSAGGYGGVVKDFAEGFGEAGGTGLGEVNGGADTEAFAAGGVVELVIGDWGDDGGAAGAEGLGGGADAAVMDVGGGAGEDL